MALTSNGVNGIDAAGAANPRNGSGMGKLSGSGSGNGNGSGVHGGGVNMDAAEGDDDDEDDDFEEDNAFNDLDVEYDDPIPPPKGTLDTGDDVMAIKLMISISCFVQREQVCVMQKPFHLS